MKKTYWTGVTGLVLFFCVCGLVLGDSVYVVREDGRRVDGLSVTANEAGEILLRVERGVLTFPKGTRVVMPRPRELDQAIQLMQQQRFPQAIDILERVVKDNRFLGWDLEGKKLLARAQTGAGRMEAAVSVYERLFAADPGAREDAEDLLRYLQSVAEVGPQDKFAALLDEAIRRGPRMVAAWAQLQRGTLAFERGDMESAILDFKRTADFFVDQDRYQPEALFRTAQSLSRLQDERSAEYHSALRERYPTSPFAVKPL